MLRAFYTTHYGIKANMVSITINSKLLSDTLPRFKKKQEFNEKVVVEDEIWSSSEKYDLYVSNLEE